MARASSVTVLDGHASIGGTKILVATGERTVLLDFGTNYRRWGELYEEFLKPRPARGLVDLLEVGLLPARRGLYRSDLFAPADYPHGDADLPDGARPDAVLLTHAHLDHCGAVAFLDPAIPVYATPATFATLRAVQESGRPDVTGETAYVADRVPQTPSLLETDRSSPRYRRTWRALGPVPPGLDEELRAAPMAKGPLAGPVVADGSSDGILRELGLRAPPVDHSLLGSAAFLLDVDGARIAYTGDVRFHGGRADETRRFLAELERRAPDLLLVEGTRLRAPGDDRPQVQTSEEEVRTRALATVLGHAGRLVIADFGPRNLERLATFQEIARATGRTLVITAKDAHLLRVLATVDRTVPTEFGADGMRIWTEPTAGRPHPWQLRLEGAVGSAFVTAADLEPEPGKWILAFSFFDANDLIDLRRATRGGLWLYSSSEAHGEEQELDFRRLANWIRWAGMTADGFEVDADGHVQFGGGYHASGHATEAELIDMVERTNARTIVPVHTEHPERYRAVLRTLGTRVVVPRPGVPIPVGSAASP